MIILWLCIYAYACKDISIKHYAGKSRSQINQTPNKSHHYVPTLLTGGEVHVINLNFRRVLYKKHFNRTVRSIKFSPDGKHFAVAKEDTG